MLKMKLYHDIFDRELPPLEEVEHLAQEAPSAEHWHMLGMVQFQKLIFHQAEVSFTEALALEATAERHFHRGVTRVIMGKFGDALDDFEAVLRFEPEHFGAHYNRGRLLARLRRYDEALEALETAQRLNRAQANRLQVGRAMRTIRRLRDGDTRESFFDRLRGLLGT